MLKEKKFGIFILLIVFTLSLLAIISAVNSYSRSVPAYTFGHQTSPIIGNQQFPIFDRNMCQAGQDFILQIDPLGCTPSVVRSDLLEDQEVVVFCPIVATQLNPLIKIKDIDHLVITSRNLPREVLTVGYHPARAALGKFDPNIDTPVLGNIGYATIVLRRQGNETAMPDFVQGNLTARLVYDIDNAFGTGRALYYLPQITDQEWENDFTAYGFWDGRGYLRLEGSDSDGATIGVYSDRDITGTGKLGEKTKIATLNLEKGGRPQEVFLPGFNYCMGGLNIQLKDLENPDTRARLRIDSEVLEIKVGDKFLENKCQVRSIAKQGINHRVQVSCQEDERRNAFTLSVSPKVRLTFNNQEAEYGIGDRLPFSDDPNKFVYLGFIGTKTGTDKEENLYVRFVQSPYRGEKLTDDMLSEVARFDNDDTPPKDTSFARRALGWVGGRVTDITQWLERFSKYLVAGTEISSPLNIGQQDDFYGTDVSLNGFSGSHDSDLSAFSNDVTDNYEKAVEDYKTIKESFASERYPSNDLKTLGESALVEAIRLANELGQRRTADELCKEFFDNYDSVAPQICNEKLLLANTQSSGQSVLINGRTHLIGLEGIKKPSSEEYGTQITVNNAGECSGSVLLGKEDDTCLSNSESIKLLRVTDEFADFDVSNVQETAGRELFWKSNNLRLKVGEFQVIGKNNYRISLDKINLKKVAKVSVDPQIDYARTNATINFKIGIEKRGIQLSPEKTREKIEKLNETIEKFTDLSNNLGKIVEAGKAACVVTGAALTIKNFFSTLEGKGAARQEVMRADGVGWYDKCQDAVKTQSTINGKGPFEDVDACLLANNAAIESSVSAYDSAIAKQNQEQTSLEEGISSTSFLGEKIVDTDALAERFIDEGNFKTEVSSNLQGISQVRIGSEDIAVSTILAGITSGTTTVSQARDLQLNSRLLSSSDSTVAAIARSNVEKALAEIYLNSRSETIKQTLSTTYEIPVVIGQTTNLREFPLSQVGTFGQVKNKFSGVGMPDETYVTLFVDQSTGKQYLLTLSNDFVITQTYLITNSVLSIADSNNINPLGISLKRYDSSTYQNPYLDPRVRYYETDPYKGLPSIVPFDTKNGWYAAVKSNLPILGGIRAYDDSGRVSSFYVCNVGSNGREENIGGDDKCAGFIPGTGVAPAFPGLNEGESRRLMDQATAAIRAATDAYRAGVSQITVNGQRVVVGEPAANIPDIQCQDFMSPSDCNLLFNVCDPVICPSSRCDLGGAYPVKDVIQSGIIGSLALCLPNYPEVKVPICVSGVNAGLEGYLSVLNSYQQCLQESLDSGATVGVCDEVNSVYMCEFFWRQGLPIAKYALPKVLGSVVGAVSGDSRGGGEYLGVTDAISNAEKSVDFFSQYYATNSFAAFKARSTEDAGGEICKNWISLTGPKGNLLDAITTPDSPTQFYGRFEEIPYTTATNPPASQYKVFYHIFAGKDFPAYFQVYLRGSGSSFFQDTNSRRPVASGFIPKGEFKTETIDFTAPTGYKELCIVVNGQEQCGFKQVTTEFGINYLSEQYVASQASQTNIRSEAECISGSPNTFSLLNPNIQAGAEEALNPAIYNRGIIRICATDNPGAGTDQTRWSQVGICGQQNLKCWLDTDSVKEVIRNANIENETLGEIENSVMNALISEGQYMDNEQFSSFTKQLDESTTAAEAVSLINTNVGKVFYNNQKAYLYLRRGNSYGSIARVAYDLATAGQKSPDTNTGTSGGTSSGTTTPPTTGSSITCTDPQSCQIGLGTKIIQLASVIKKQRGILDPNVKEDTGAESFECLVLQVAMIESDIKHCKNNTIDSNGNPSYLNNNPLYCNGNVNQVISGDDFNSLGVMQINIGPKAHPDAAPTVYSFDANVNYGINLLISESNLPSRKYVCNGKTYEGWSRALREYNGWPETDNIDCTQGNPNYVEQVIGSVNRNAVSSLFPECA